MKSCPTCDATYQSDFTICPRDGTGLVDVDIWSTGTLVRGKYRIVSQLGEGGMATVYKAVHVGFDELRALKVMRPEFASKPSFVKRFLREARMTRLLQHPNAVHVDDIDQAEDGRPFIVMEFVEGRSLRVAIQEEAPFEVERACSITKQVARALSQAESLGIVHRDIKPENIVLVFPSQLSEATGNRRPANSVSIVDRQTEQVKVLDFGIAKLKDAHFGIAPEGPSTLTRAGLVMGTADYISPEQLSPGPGVEPDCRSDIYSLGIVAYQMLTADLPLKADSITGILLAHLHVPPIPILRLRPDLPPAIADLVMCCLEKHPDSRPTNASVLIKQIEDWEKQAKPSCGQSNVVTTAESGGEHTKFVKGPSVSVALNPATTSRRLSRGSWILAPIFLLLLVGFTWRVVRPSLPVSSVSPRVQATSGANFDRTRPTIDAATVSVPSPREGARHPTSEPVKMTPSVSVRQAGMDSLPKPSPIEAALPAKGNQSPASADPAPTSLPSSQMVTKPATAVPEAVAKETPPKVMTSSSLAQVEPPADHGTEAKELFEEGKLKLSAKHYEEAAAIFGKSSRLMPSWGAPLVERIKINAKLGRFDEVIEDCNQALRQNPSDPVVLNFRGYARTALNQFKEAVSDLDEAIRLDPDYCEAYDNRGNAKWASKDKIGGNADYSERKLCNVRRGRP
jgi:serine/threonine protein kinase